MGRTFQSAAQQALNDRSTPWGTLAGLSRNVELLILGPLEARVDGRPVALGAPRQRLVLAALLLAAPAPLPREQLIDEVWPAAPPASARHAVEVYVSRLRGALGPAAIAGEPGPSYAAAGWVDARPAAFAAVTWQETLRPRSARRTVSRLPEPTLFRLTYQR